MSNTNGARNLSEATFKSARESSKSVRFVRASELSENGTTGVVALGTYQGTVPNNIDATKMDFKIMEQDGTIVIVNSAGNLGARMAQAIEEGGLELNQGIRIMYFGKQEAKKGRLKGKFLHAFDVEIEDTSA
jgi:hypothetical protein